MSMFDFGSIAAVSAASSNSFLRPWNIYEDVKFAGISDKISGTRQSGEAWNAWDFTFECPQGKYSERIFEPLNNDRRSYTDKNGHEREFPSDFERSMTFFAQVVGTFNPKGFEKLKEKSGKVTTFEQMIQLVKAVMKDVNTTTKMKIVGVNRSGKVYAGLPTFCSINSQTGEKYTSDNFIGDTVAFSAWELNKKKEYESAKPTNMSEVVKDDVLDSATTTSSDNIDDLLADI